MKCPMAPDAGPWLPFPHDHCENPDCEQPCLYGGSHYHCARCESGEVLGMCGHYVGGALIEGKWHKFLEGHMFLCSDEYAVEVARIKRRLG